MLSAHRQADDEHSKWYVLIKGNRNLKPHQPGMAKTGEVQQGFVGSTHWEQDRSLSRGPFSFIRLSVWLVAPTTGLSCSELSSKGWFRLCVAGERAYSSVLWSRPRTVTGGTPVPSHSLEIHSPYVPVRFWLCPTIVEMWDASISARFYLLSVDTIIISEDFIWNVLVIIR